MSVDPILEKYLPTGDKNKDSKLPGMGGIYNSRNLGMYGYVGLNPVLFIDPDGREIFNPKKYKVDAGTMKLLKKLDSKTPGVDYRISSGSRTKKQNKKVGGAKNSHHLDTVSGTAIDVNPIISDKSDISLNEIAGEAESTGFTGIITYPHNGDPKKNMSNAKDGRLHLDRRAGSKFTAEAYKATLKSGKTKTRYKNKNFKPRMKIDGMIGDFPKPEPMG